MAAAVLPGALAQNNQNAAPPRPVRRPTQGGTGPVQVLLITKGHPFDREGFFQLFDELGKEITWTHVEQPAAQVFFDPVRAEPYDAFVLYDMAGKAFSSKPDGSMEMTNLEPSVALKKGMRALLEKGKGMVFLHHAMGSWVNWPEYHEVVGGAADWQHPLDVRGKAYPNSGYRGGTQQHLSVVDKTHPVVKGLGEGFDITDETFLFPVFESSVHPLLTTNFKRIDSNFEALYAKGWRHPEGGSLSAWYKTAENSPIVYIEGGHDATAWTNPGYRTLLSNAIGWVASKDAKAWAAANRARIFK